MIVRDEHGIIVQHPSMDGGDSAARMGISALENDELLLQFLTGECFLLRHPYQFEWYSYLKTSRDQLVQYCVSRKTGPRIVAGEYKDKWFINKDFLSPAVKLYLYKVHNMKSPLWLKALGYLEMHVSMFWNTRVKPDEELNQFACMCIVYGPYWSNKLIAKHHNIMDNILGYWSGPKDNDINGMPYDGWRDQIEIGRILLRTLVKTAGEK